jgi:large subunit ribosomal protein L33
LGIGDKGRFRVAEAKFLPTTNYQLPTTRRTVAGVWLDYTPWKSFCWAHHFAVALGRWLVCPDPSTFSTMQEVVTLECTEAKKEGKPVSRYLTTRNKKTVTERIEKKKYNPNLRRHTLHKEIK